MFVLDESVGRLSESEVMQQTSVTFVSKAEITVRTRSAWGCGNAVTVEILVQRQNTQGRNLCCTEDRSKWLPSYSMLGKHWRTNSWALRMKFKGIIFFALCHLLPKLLLRHISQLKGTIMLSQRTLGHRAPYR